MKTYRVRITETLEKEVYIESESIEEALAEAEIRWKDSEYILDADSFTNVSFSQAE